MDVYVENVAECGDFCSYFVASCLSQSVFPCQCVDEYKHHHSKLIMIYHPSSSDLYIIFKQLLKA